MTDSLSRSELFAAMSPQEIETLLGCLSARERHYQKDEIILLEGAPTEHLGVVLSGSVVIEMGDAWGNHSILGAIGPGGTFAEAYACAPEEPMLVTVSAAQSCSVLLVNAGRVLSTCPRQCPQHSLLIRNLLTLTARKNIQLSRRMQYTAPKTIRGRLMSYFSECAKRAGGPDFTLPFNRQQLADYLSVDRSALCTELGKMQKDGLIRYEKNRIEICSS